MRVDRARSDPPNGPRYHPTSKRLSACIGAGEGDGCRDADHAGLLLGQSRLAIRLALRAQSDRDLSGERRIAGLLDNLDEFEYCYRKVHGAKAGRHGPSSPRVAWTREDGRTARKRPNTGLEVLANVNQLQ